MNRRDFLAAAGTVGVAPLVAGRRRRHTHRRRPEVRPERTGLSVMTAAGRSGARTISPHGTLQGADAGRAGRRTPIARGVSHLEALGRLRRRHRAVARARGRRRHRGGRCAAHTPTSRGARIARAVDPASPDFLNFTRGRPAARRRRVPRAGRAARAARARARRSTPTTPEQLVAALESTRAITPGFNNWLLFSATVEAALQRSARGWDRMRVDYALRQHEQWYKGDGVYGDGPAFHWDYYNSFVIQPMLLDVLDVCRDEMPAWKELRERASSARARRYAAILERLIAPDGTFPPIGRSIAYRFGAFQLLAQMALRRALPESVDAGAGARRADRDHPALDRGARHVRRRRLAAHRLLRPPAGRRRDLHLDRQPVSLRRRPAAARPAGGRSRSGPPRPQPWTSVRAVVAGSRFRSIARLRGSAIPGPWRAGRP